MDRQTAVRKPDPTYQPGDNIGGRFRVHQALMGSMGEVYLCLDTERNYPLALKTFQSRFLTNRKLRNAFYTEVATWIALEKHPNIVRCFYMDTVEGRPFMFMEWVASDEHRGTDLRSWLRKGPLPLGQAITFAIDICRGLLHAHKKQPGIVHRDLKPENILVAQGSVAKITDFGLASIVKDSDLALPEEDAARSERQSMVGAGGVVGTPAYMAPEQWRAEDLDVRTDLYAVGCILYEMLTGRLPYIAKNLEGFLMEHLKGSIPRLPVGDQIPQELNDVIGRTLAKKRTERYESVEALVEALSTIYEARFNEPPRLLPSTGGFTAVDYTSRGVTYDKLDRYDEALQDYARAIRLDPSFVLVYNNRGATYERLRRYDDAIDDYTSAIEYDPALAQAYYNRGNVYSKIKRPEDAIVDFTRALRLDPNLMRAHMNRGSEYIAIDRPEQALEDFSAAIDLAPGYAKAYVNRALVYDHMQKFEEALEDYSRALEITPRDQDIYFNRGLTHFNMERHTQAFDDFNRVLDLHADDVEALYYRGQCHAKLNRQRESIYDHARAIALTESSTMAFLNLGAILYQRGAIEEARICFKAASQLGDGRGAAWLAQIDAERKRRTS